MTIQNIYPSEIFNFFNLALEIDLYELNFIVTVNYLNNKHTIVLW